MSLPSAFRLLRTGVGEPAWNMALDEALLEGYAVEAPPILRLYGWAPAGLSLGRFQPSGGVEVPEGAVLVRRLSGGSAIHHRLDEVTYSVIAPYRIFGGLDPRLAYNAIHAAIEEGLARLGVDASSRDEASGRASRHGLCFANPTDYDLVVAGRKLVGSAQRRRGRAFLQHGSIPLSPDPRVPGASSLSCLLGRTPTREEVEEALLAGFARLASSWNHDAVRETERASAEGLVRSRYGSASWTHAK
jgi:lipoyl(octanoyl) transferase